MGKKKGSVWGKGCNQESEREEGSTKEGVSASKELQKSPCSLGQRRAQDGSGWLRMASVSGVGLELALSSSGVGVRAGAGTGVWWGKLTPPRFSAQAMGSWVVCTDVSSPSPPSSLLL